MDENPSSPEDGLEDALRRALSDAVGGIEPGPEGLDSIRARIARRPPRPWLLAVLSSIVERVRFWTWRGHWAWPRLPVARAHLPWLARRPRQRRRVPTERPGRRGDTFPLPGIAGAGRMGVLWLATGLGGIVVIASVSFGVQPVREAIIQASAVLGGGPFQPRGGAGTNGAGTQTSTEGTGSLADGGATGAAQPSPASASGSPGGPGGAAPGPGSPAGCQPSAASATGNLAPTPAEPDSTSSAGPAEGTLSSDARHAPFPTASGVTGPTDQPAATQDPSAPACLVTPGSAATTSPAQPDDSIAPSTPADTAPAETTPTETVPAGPPTDTASAGATPTDTPTSTGTPTSTPTDPAPTDTPTGTTPTDTPTDPAPTDTASGTTPADTATSTATDTTPAGITPADPTATGATPTDTTPPDSTPADSTPADPAPASPPPSAPADAIAGPGSAPVTAAGPALTVQDESPVVLTESGAWRWYARLWFLNHERHLHRR